MGTNIDLNTGSFSLSSFYTIEWYKARYKKLVSPDQTSNSLPCHPFFVNATPRYLNFLNLKTKNKSEVIRSLSIFLNQE